MREFPGVRARSGRTAAVVMSDGAAQIPGDDLVAAARLAPGETLDAVCRGELFVIQRRDGYRFSVDAVLLAAFAGRPPGRVVELGAGSGVVSLLLAYRGAEAVVGVELQRPLFELAERNVLLNGLAGRVQLVHGDLRALRGVLPAKSFDLAVCNPPYVPRGGGRLNPVEEKALARHELTCSVPELAGAARRLLRDGGVFKVIFPAPRLTELLAELRAAGLEPRRLLPIHSLPRQPARLVLVEAVKGGGCALDLLPAMALFADSGTCSPELRRLLDDAGATLEPGQSESGAA